MMLMDIVIDTIKDTYLMLPLLFVTYIVIEYFDRKEKNDAPLFISLQKYGVIVGALVGIIPQCGFSIIASMLYINRNITLGTLLSVFIATSDEAIPVLLANPTLYDKLLLILVMKIILAIVVGFVVDKVLFPKQSIQLFNDTKEDVEMSGSCDCCYTQYSLFLSAFLRALKIYVFLFITTFILNIVITLIGEHNLQQVLLSDSFLQPVLAALFGFIPNCAASVVLTQLYVSGSVSFASLFAGLVTNAGLGFIVLWRYQARKQIIIKVLMILFASAVIMGFILQGWGPI